MPAHIGDRLKIEVFLFLQFFEFPFQISTRRGPRISRGDPGFPPGPDIDLSGDAAGCGGVGRGRGGASTDLRTILGSNGLDGIAPRRTYTRPSPSSGGRRVQGPRATGSPSRSATAMTSTALPLRKQDCATRLGSVRLFHRAARSFFGSRLRCRPFGDASLHASKSLSRVCSRRVTGHAPERCELSCFLRAHLLRNAKHQPDVCLCAITLIVTRLECAYVGCARLVDGRGSRTALVGKSGSLLRWLGGFPRGIAWDVRV